MTSAEASSAMDNVQSVSESIRLPCTHTDPLADLPSSPKAAPTPPTSEDMNRDKQDASSSELSDLEDEDEEEIEPDHYFEGGKIPVFKPTMDQFRSFKKFVDKIDKYGMRSGIVKVIPPKEWRDSLPDLTEAVKTIKVKNPITQEFAGQHGIYTQANIEKQRSYNLPEWKALTEEHHHQPPARRGERRRGDVPPRTRSTRSGASTTTSKPANDGPKRKPGRPRRVKKEEVAVVKQEEQEVQGALGVPPTPTSPAASAGAASRASKAVKTTEKDDTASKPRGRQPKSISSRRKNNRQDASDEVDEEAFKGFDYHLENVDEFTPERCRELEDIYWKTINYGQPMYGADMPGSLFDDTTTSWNVAHLENILDVLGTKVPGVNTAYLYLGMWKATFAWHLEDVDLYSINYIHFGAPKQWYSISQEDARRFENAMKSIWPRDAKNCSQFLRHKTYLISPYQLEKQFNIKVNKLVHYEGEFVITYPYGYHSGFNLGYNCAESVNFANEAWLDYGRIAKKCECESDSVWIDVAEIERKLRGEPTPEYYEETDVEEEEEEPSNLPSPPASVKGKAASRKRKRDTQGKDEPQGKVKRIKIRLRAPIKEPPCILCPNDVVFDTLLPTDNGSKAHRLCALYTPETFISDTKPEKVCNVSNIDKARLEMRCLYCRSKRGAVFQCSAKKCTRAFHATCAPAAGVLVDDGSMQTFGEDGTEYVYEGYDFRCKYHRPKRPKNADGDSLEEDKRVKEYAQSRKAKDVVQYQYLGGSGEVYAGTVVENRPSELSMIVDVLPDGGRVEVEWKYLLVLDPAESQRPKPTANAKPLPSHMNSSNSSLDTKNRKDGIPEMGDPFHDPNAPQKWAEMNQCPEAKNPYQAKIDLSKAEQIWFYLGKTSTEARAQFTEDPTKERHNRKSNFLDTVKPPPPPPAQKILPRASFSGAYPQFHHSTPSSQQFTTPSANQPYHRKSSVHAIDARHQTSQFPPYSPYAPQAQNSPYHQTNSAIGSIYSTPYAQPGYLPTTPQAHQAPQPLTGEGPQVPQYGHAYSPYQTHHQPPQIPAPGHPHYQPYYNSYSHVIQQRPQQQTMPLANTGSTGSTVHEVVPPHQTDPAAQSSRNVGAGGPATPPHSDGSGLGLSNPTASINSQLPGFHYQTAQQFQTDVARLPAQPQTSGLARFESMIQQLQTGHRAAGSHPNPAMQPYVGYAHTTIYGHPRHMAGQPQSTSSPPTTTPSHGPDPNATSAKEVPSQPQPSTPMSIGETRGAHSPKRPDVSPISDSGWSHRSPQAQQSPRPIAPHLPAADSISDHHSDPRVTPSADRVLAPHEGQRPLSGRAPVSIAPAPSTPVPQKSEVPIVTAAAGGGA